MNKLYCNKFELKKFKAQTYKLHIIHNKISKLLELKGQWINEITYKLHIKHNNINLIQIKELMGTLLV